MYNQNNNNNCGGMYGGMNGGYPSVAPVIAPKKVCVVNSCQYVEQPVICPIEYRRVNQLVYYPRYYPRYEQTVVNQGPAQYPQGNMNQFQQQQQYQQQTQTQNQFQNTEIDIDINNARR